MLVQLDTKKFVSLCVRCHRMNTHYFNVGSCKSSEAPFKLADGDTLKFQFDADGGNVGVIREVTFHATDFKDIAAVSLDEMVAFLMVQLPNADVLSDYGAVLVNSKTTGPTSCVEVVDGTAHDKLGYDPRRGDVERFCCGRPVLGYLPPGYTSQGFPGAIMLRRCVCGGQPQLMWQLAPAAPSSGNLMVNTLALYLFNQGWVDPDLAEFFRGFTGPLSGVLAPFPANGLIYNPVLSDAPILYPNPA